MVTMSEGVSVSGRSASPAAQGWRGFPQSELVASALLPTDLLQSRICVSGPSVHSGRADAVIVTEKPNRSAAGLFTRRQCDTPPANESVED